MRKPRDFDAELKALDDKARRLREQRLRQLGELVIACGADHLTPETLAGALLTLKDANAATTEGWRRRGARPSFSARPASHLAALIACRTALSRSAVQRNRLELRRARVDNRAWVVKRRERTRQLIELGGLVAKTGLADLPDDDRAVLFGALLDLAATLQGADREQALLIWRRRGKRAFEADADMRSPG